MNEILGPLIIGAITIYCIYTLLETIIIGRELRRIRKNPPNPSNLGKEGLLGRIGLLESDLELDPDGGRNDCKVKIGSEIWNSKLVNFTAPNIRGGSKVIVKNIDGLTLYVEPYDDR